MYKKFYGFKERPFEITPNPSYVYLSEKHKEALAHLQYAINEGKGFSVITGEAGTGKTTLVYKLLSNLRGNIRICYIFNPMIERKDLLKYICSDLGVETGSIKTGAQPQLLLYNFLLNCFTNNEKVFLFIDEAHCLDPDLLQDVRLLTNLETAKSKLLHVVLLGQPELNDILARPEFRPLKQRISVRYHLCPLQLEETKEYILFRLKRSGSRNIKLFSDSAIKEIYRYSQGLPRLINIVCDNALLSGFSLERYNIDKDIIRNVIKDMEIPGRDGEKRIVNRLLSFFHLIQIIIIIFLLYNVAGVTFPGID
ncbi:MAG TPA: AAA family ATPase [Smithella sp.]|nr:AAA family ATPase [Smithella sp.]